VAAAWLSALAVAVTLTSLTTARAPLPPLPAPLPFTEGSAPVAAAVAMAGRDSLPPICAMPDALSALQPLPAVVPVFDAAPMRFKITVTRRRAPNTPVWVRDDDGDDIEGEDDDAADDGEEMQMGSDIDGDGGEGVVEWRRHLLMSLE
jgi:hypothetical protein